MRQVFLQIHFYCCLKRKERINDFYCVKVKFSISLKEKRPKKALALKELTNVLKVELDSRGENPLPVAVGRITYFVGSAVVGVSQQRQDSH